MPTATKFEAEGVDNGFPFCFPYDTGFFGNFLGKTDVSGFDAWTSLSGWSKVNEPATDELKAASIAESRRLAMQIFWNLSEVVCDIFSTSISEGNTSLTSSDIYGVKPKDRVCLNNSTDIVEFEKIDQIDSQNLSRIEAEIVIIMMYNGSKDDEANFVGFGIAQRGGSPYRILDGIEAQSQSRADTRPDGGLASRGCGVRIFSYYETISTGSGVDFDYTVMNIAGVGDFNFYCFAFASNSPNRVLNASSRYAYTDGDIDGAIAVTSQCEITSLDFYTYPA